MGPLNLAARVCRENELVIETWSPIHLRAKLKELYWNESKPAVRATAFWEDTLRYLYLPRLKLREVLGGRRLHCRGQQGLFRYCLRAD